MFIFPVCIFKSSDFLAFFAYISVKLSDDPVICTTYPHENYFYSPPLRPTHRLRARLIYILLRLRNREIDISFSRYYLSKNYFRLKNVSYTFKFKMSITRYFDHFKCKNNFKKKDKKWKKLHYLYLLLWISKKDDEFTMTIFFDWHQLNNFWLWIFLSNRCKL